MNPPSLPAGLSPCQGVVLRATRRSVQVLTGPDHTVKARLTSKVPGVAVGDLAACQPQGRDTVITSVFPRKNCLFRSYRSEKKEIAANLDRLFIVAAPHPLFNTAFIDRVLVFCALQSIPAALVVNKIDLDLSVTRPLINLYHALDVPVIHSSAAAETGLAELRAALADTELKIAALAGVSGVGKSSLLNRLIPGLDVKTAGLSEKIGQGRRTTSQAIAYTYLRPPAPDMLLIDLPGVHAFGVSSLSQREVAESFPEFTARRGGCEFIDCLHLAEPRCAVKDALEKGQIAESRYLSYAGMLDEIRAARPY